MVAKKKSVIKKVSKKPSENRSNKSSKKPSFFSNYWAVACIILAILLVLSLISNSFETVKISVAEQNTLSLISVAEQNTLSFLNSQTGGGVELVSSEDSGDYYIITVSYQGQEVPLSVTKDGKNLVQVTSIVSEPIKSDKPLVELFVWAYCPYGVQAQGPFSQVAKLLGDSAEFVLVPYYDGHGPYETQQNKIESCIQEVAPSEFWEYSERFVSEVYPACSSVRTEECDLTESVIIMEDLGIDVDSVIECIESKGRSLNSAASQLARDSGVSGSPTIRINGQIVNVNRNAEAIKTAVCSAYNEVPTECGEVIESTATTTGSASVQC